jgi:hypothetical protein
MYEEGIGMNSRFANEAIGREPDTVAPEKEEVKPITIPESFQFLNSFYAEGSKEFKQAAQISQYLRKERSLDDKVIARYGVGMSMHSFLGDSGKYSNKLCVAFPWKYPDSEGKFQTVRLKLRYVAVQPSCRG